MKKILTASLLTVAALALYVTVTNKGMLAGASEETRPVAEVVETEVVESDNYTIRNLTAMFRQSQSKGLDVTDEYIDSYFSHVSDDTRIISGGEGYFSSEGGDSQIEVILPGGATEMKDIEGPDATTAKEAREALKAIFDN